MSNEIIHGAMVVNVRLAVTADPRNQAEMQDWSWCLLSHEPGVRDPPSLYKLSLQHLAIPLFLNLEITATVPYAMFSRSRNYLATKDYSNSSLTSESSISASKRWSCFWKDSSLGQKMEK